MAYFNYHAKAKKLIREGFLISYEVVERYKDIIPALVLHFSNHKPMPIREERWHEYFDLISEVKDIPKKEKL